MQKRAGEIRSQQSFRQVLDQPVEHRHRQQEDEVHREGDQEGQEENGRQNNQGLTHGGHGQESGGNCIEASDREIKEQQNLCRCHQKRP